jgi:uncharacterized protein (TIGR02996 family)
MTRYDELLAAVTSNPEDDAARLAFAAHIRPSEPDRAQFIDKQVKQAQQRRQARGPRTNTDDPLLMQHETTWSRTIAKYATRWIFDRGFIASIRIDPYLFLEYGEWLLKNAPIREVEFSKPMEGPFPMAELVESSLLSRLDTIGLHDDSLTQHDLEPLATCRHFDRLAILSSVELKVDHEIYAILAENSQIRKALSVLFSEQGFPGQRYEQTGQDDMQGRAVYAWTDLAPEGRILEARHGYLPWLHRENLCGSFDAAWYVAQGILPVQPPGSPVG